MIEFKDVRKIYKEHEVLKGISFRVEKGELVVLIGPSGCGKTTTLKMINRLLDPTEGAIFINDRNILERDEIELRRNIGYVIQHTGLFPHLTVRENIELVPKLSGHDPKKVVEKSVELMQMIGLEPEAYLDRYPIQLSGGQQQRVGVARAFACDPEIILMDEPFSAVDPIARAQLQDELIDIQSKLQKTIVFVTHDIGEAVKVGDRICIMDGGAIVQYGRCEDVLKKPANDFVSEFVGKYRIWTTPELIRAKDIMLTDPVTCPIGSTVFRCMETMRRNNVNTVFLTNRRTFMGMIRGNAVRECADKTRKAIEIAETDCQTVKPKDSIPTILTTVQKMDNATVIPVVDEGGILHGLLTQGSLVTTLGQQFIDTDKAK